MDGSYKDDLSQSDNPSLQIDNIDKDMTTQLPDKAEE